MRNINELPADIDKHLVQALIKMEEVEEELESCMEIREQYVFTEAHLIEENRRLIGEIEKLGALPQIKESKALPGDAPKDVGDAELLENDTD